MRTSTPTRDRADRRRRDEADPDSDRAAVLVVHVQRWDPKTRVQARVLVEHRIELPVFPAPTTERQAPAEGAAATRVAYGLVGAVHHHGRTADSGHYVADARLDGACSGATTRTFSPCPRRCSPARAPPRTSPCTPPRPRPTQANVTLMCK